MSETIHDVLLRFLEDSKQLQRFIYLQDDDYKRLLQRYDDAQKRIHDMQAELEYLRMEVNRG